MLLPGICLMPRDDRHCAAGPINPQLIMNSSAADPVYLSAAEQGRLIRDRKLSPVELMQACLARIERWNPVLCAYITVLAESAMAEARAAEREITAGRWRGPLHGLPFGVKDQLNTKGIRTTLGSRMLGDNVPDHDAAVIEKLKAAGAILIGKENLHEFGKGGHHRFCLRPAAQSLEHRVQPGEFIEWLGYRAGSGIHLGIPGRGYRRFDPQPGGGQRHRRPAPHIRPRQPLGRRDVRLDRRHHRPADAHGRGQCVVPAGDRRA